MKPRVLVLRAPGTNCDLETAHTFELAGGAAERVHIERLLEKPKQAAADFQIMAIPGGFSYGDDLAAGRILGTQFRLHLADAMRAFKDRGGLILGICIGFQILMKSGLLLADDAQGTPATLTLNDCGMYQDRWVNLAAEPGKCVFLTDISSMYLPMAHAEGKFVARDEAEFTRLEGAGQLVLRYVAKAGDKASRGMSTLPFPACPNGAQGNVAGVCDSTGRVLGLMPHPERHIDVTHHPRWTRGEGREGGDGLRLFQNAVRFFA